MSRRSARRPGACTGRRTVGSAAKDLVEFPIVDEITCVLAVRRQLRPWPYAAHGERVQLRGGSNPARPDLRRGEIPKRRAPLGEGYLPDRLHLE